MAGKLECRGYMVGAKKGKKINWGKFTEKWGPYANRSLKGK